MRLGLIIVLVLACACRDVTLPLPRTAGPGTVRATVVLPKPGKSGLSPAEGAQLQWSLSSELAVADAEGNVTLGGIMSSEGVLRLSVPGFERLIDLKLAKVGYGRDVNLGTLVLGRTSTIVGRVRRGDVVGESGHSGIAVFVPETALIASSADTGEFELTAVPEGDVSLSFFALGYGAASTRVSLRAGERLSVDDLVLTRSNALQTGNVSCAVVASNGDAVANAQVTLSQNVLGARDGRFVATMISAGLYSLTVTAPGFKTLRSANRLVLPGDNDFGTLALAPGVSSGDGDGGAGGADAGGLSVRGSFSTASPPSAASGLRVRAGGFEIRSRVCSGTLCVTGGLSP